MTFVFSEPGRQTLVFGDYESSCWAASTAAHMALRSDAWAIDVDTQALQARLESDGAYLGRSW